MILWPAGNVSSGYTSSERLSDRMVFVVLFYGKDLCMQAFQVCNLMDDLERSYFIKY